MATAPGLMLAAVPLKRKLRNNRDRERERENSIDRRDSLFRREDTIPTVKMSHFHRKAFRHEARPGGFDLDFLRAGADNLSNFNQMEEHGQYADAITTIR